MANDPYHFPLPEPPEWHERALCRKYDSEMFFPGSRSKARYAQRVCDSCPVQLECLSDAMDRGERNGVWGGRVFGIHG